MLTALTDLFCGEVKKVQALVRREDPSPPREAVSLCQKFKTTLKTMGSTILVIRANIRKWKV